jgi:hypothetical protein
MKLAIGVIVLAAAGSAAADAPRIIDKPVPRIDYEVVDRGVQANRVPLRYALEPGAAARGRIEIDETTWGRRFPHITLDVRSEVTGGDAAGRIHFREVVTGVSLDAAGAAEDFDLPAMRLAYDAAIGLACETTIDTRGITSARRIVVARPEIDAYVLDHVGGYLGGLSWLPEEAVGVGAKWRTTRTEVDDDGRTVAHTTTVAFLGRRGNRIELEDTTSSSGGAQPEDRGLAVTSATGRSTSRLAIQLDRLAWTWTYASTARYKAIRDGVRQDVEMRRASRGSATPEFSR